MQKSWSYNFEHQIHDSGISYQGKNGNFTRNKYF
jgi:hypothetical protein